MGIYAITLLNKWARMNSRVDWKMHWDEDKAVWPASAIEITSLCGRGRLLWGRERQAQRLMKRQSQPWKPVGRTSHKDRTSGEGPKAAASCLFGGRREARNVLKLATISILNLKILIGVCLCVYNSILPTQGRKKITWSRIPNSNSDLHSHPAYKQGFAASPSFLSTHLSSFWCQPF